MDFLLPSIPIIQALQSISWLQKPMELVTTLGNEQFFLLLLPLIYWLYDRKMGAKLGILLLVSVCLNDIFKLIFHMPRPYWFVGVKAFADANSLEKSFGFPSGHAQNAALLWPFFAFQTKNKKLWLSLSVVLIALISLSRVYLGFHFPIDIIGGWIIGLVLLVIALQFQDFFVSRWRNFSAMNRLALTFVMAGFIALAFGIAGMGQEFHDDGSWYSAALWNAGESMIARIAALTGLFVGLAFAPRFETSGPIIKKALRLLVGLIGLGVFYVGLKKVLPDESTYRFIRYFLTTFWVIFAAPTVFLKLGLAEFEAQKRPVD